MTGPDEFYIGYEGAMPAATARRVRSVVALAAVGAIAAAVIVTMAQTPLAPASFEFGQSRTVDGFLTLAPAPALLVREDGRWLRYWLIAQGKFGPERELTSAREGWVRVTAARIAREEWQMLEIVPGGIVSTAGGEPAPPVPATVAQPFRARGEIVDSKCFLGVMNPGERTVHRDCAVRCLSGGIPAMFAYRDGNGHPHLALLLRPDGQRVGDEVRRAAGVPREITGTLLAGDGIEALVMTP
jgi:hypothetical protein